MNEHAVTVLCLVAAAVCYVVGLGLGVELAIAAGFISEIIFWYRVSRSATRTVKRCVGETLALTGVSGYFRPESLANARVFLWK